MSVENQKGSNGILGAALLFGLGVVDLIDHLSIFGGCITLVGAVVLIVFLLVDD